jgi:hypothetical protein
MPTADARALEAPDTDWSSVANSDLQLGLDGLIETRYYESRLAPHRDQIDYLVALPRSAASLALERIVSRTRQSTSSDERWQAIVRLLESWADGRSLTSTQVPILWLEHDDILANPRHAVPSVSVCITPGYRMSAELPPRHPRDLALAQEVLTLLDVGFGNQRAGVLTAAFDELPPRARWIHVSYMLGRNPRSVKLYGALQRCDLPDFLERMGWAGERGAIEYALRTLYPAELLGDEVFVDLDLENFDDGKRCSLGLAASQQQVLRGPDRDPARGQILEAWSAAGLCDPDKVKRVQAWLACGPARTERPFRRQTRFLDLKLVWQAEAGFTAKAYAGERFARGLF